MFNGCQMLTLLDLNNFETSNLKTMSKMFYKCSSLRNLDLELDSLKQKKHKFLDV